MKLILSSLAAIACLSASLPAAAFAPRQSEPRITVGAAVVDEAGNPVGSIESIQGADVVVRTDRHQARIPRSSLRANRDRLVISMTRAQLNAAVERLTPPPPVQLATGVVVRGSAGEVAGTIETVAQDHIILRLGSGGRASLPRTAVGANAQGAFISITAEELQRRVEAAAPTNTTTEASEAASTASD